MKVSPKVKNILIVIYVVFMIFGAYYINSISKYTPINQIDDSKNNPVKSKPAKVTLVVNGLKTYDITLLTTDSVSYLLDQLRQDKAFDYEKTRYTYGIEINTVNGEIAPEGYKWKIFQDGKDISFSINDIELMDQKTYELNLVKQ